MPTREVWSLTIPGGGIKSDPREVRWAIPADHPEGWFFLELTLAKRAGERTSRQVYSLRVVKALTEAGARRAWQSAPVPEPPTSVGPWLRPQIEGVPTSLEAKNYAHPSGSSEPFSGGRNVLLN